MSKSPDDMRVDVTIGVPKPEAVDRPSRAGNVAHSTGHINVVHGGLHVLNNEEGDDGWLIANAIIVISLDDGK